MSIAKLFEIAASISSPLGLSGIFVVILFFIILRLISQKIFPRLTETIGAKIIILIITGLYYLTFIAIVLGFIGFIFGKVYHAPPTPKPATENTPEYLPKQHLETYGKQSPIIQDNKGTVIINGAPQSPTSNQGRK